MASGSNFHQAARRMHARQLARHGEEVDYLRAAGGLLFAGITACVVEVPELAELAGGELVMAGPQPRVGLLLEDVGDVKPRRGDTVTRTSDGKSWLVEGSANVRHGWAESRLQEVLS